MAPEQFEDALGGVFSEPCIVSIAFVQVALDVRRRSRVAATVLVTATADKVIVRGELFTLRRAKEFPGLVEFQGRRFTPPALFVSGVTPVRAAPRAPRRNPGWWITTLLANSAFGGHR